MATRNPVARAIASATSRVWFPATLAFTRNLPRRSHAPRRPRARRVYYRLRPEVPARRAGQPRRHPRRCPRILPRCGACAFEMVVSHFSAWVDFLHFATRPPEDAARLVESVVGYSHIVEGRLRRQGRPPPDRPPRQLGGRRPDARAGQAADPRRARARHLPRRRAGAAAPARALRRDRDPRRPQLRADAVGPARARPERDRGHAGRPGLRQHRSRRRRSSGARPSFRGAPCAWRWPRARPSCRPSSCACPTAATARSSRSRCRSRPRATATRRCARTSSATWPSSSATCGEYPEQWYCFYPFWDDPVAEAETEGRAGGSRQSTAEAGGHSTRPAGADGRDEERVVVPRQLLDVRAGSPAARSRRPRKARRQFSGVRKPWFGRVAGSVATPVKFSRKLKTNST